ncbi:MAG: hypothetical protein WCF04_14425 [Candidatus Nanopelagicales bacterium]
MVGIPSAILPCPGASAGLTLRRVDDVPVWSIACLVTTGAVASRMPRLGMRRDIG